MTFLMQKLVFKKLSSIAICKKWRLHSQSSRITVKLLFQCVLLSVTDERHSAERPDNMSSRVSNEHFHQVATCEVDKNKPGPT
jgi:hypothetical protein